MVNPNSNLNIPQLLLSIHKPLYMPWLWGAFAYTLAGRFDKPFFFLFVFQLSLPHNTEPRQCTHAPNGEHDHIASDLFNIHVVTEFSRDVIILTYNGCVLKLNR